MEMNIVYYSLTLKEFHDDSAHLMDLSENRYRLYDEPYIPVRMDHGMCVNRTYGI